MLLRACNSSYCLLIQKYLQKPAVSSGQRHPDDSGHTGHGYREPAANGHHLGQLFAARFYCAVLPPELKTATSVVATLGTT